MLARKESAGDPTLSGRTRQRLAVLGLISFATVINYLDRAIMGVAAPAIAHELSIGPTAMGVIFSAFSWTYALCQIPGGLALDKLGTRLTYALSLGLWSFFALLHGFSAGVFSLFVMRLALGAAEAPCFPTNSKVLSTWFPQHERARANSVYAVGQYVGLAFLSPVLFWVTMSLGWRALFIICGGIGVAYSGVWWVFYRDPKDNPKVNPAELEYIRGGGAIDPSATAAPFSWENVRKLISTRQMIGAAIGQFCSNSTLVFFLTWFPTYLATERHMNWMTSGVYAVLPYLFASVGVLAGGVLSDSILARTGSANLGRKLPIVCGLLLASTIILANFSNDNFFVICVMSVAFLGQGMANLGWTLISDVSPPTMLGLSGGIFNFCTNLSGIATPIVIGVIVSTTGSFFSALAFVGALAIVGALAYIFVLGDVRRLVIEQREAVV